MADNSNGKRPDLRLVDDPSKKEGRNEHRREPNPPRPSPSPEGNTPEDWVIKALRALSRFMDEWEINTPKMRWRLHNMEKDVAASRDSRLNPTDPNAIPRNCPSCNQIAGAGKERCPHCKAPLTGPGAWLGAARRSVRLMASDMKAMGASAIILRIELVMWVVTILLSTQFVGPKAIVNSSSKALLMLGSLHGVLIAEYGQYWRLITTMFLHGGLMHVAFNLIALVQLGAMTERIYGSSRFLLIFMVSGLAGDVGGFVSRGVGVRSVGASGAIFGLLGALFVFTRLHERHANSRAHAMFKTWIIYGLLFGFAMNFFGGVGGAQVDNAAHIGGLIGGAAMAWVMGNPAKPWGPAWMWRALGIACWVLIALSLGAGALFTMDMMQAG